MSGPVLDFESQKNIKCNKNEIKNQLKTLCVRTDPVAYNVTSINNPFHSSSMTSYVATIVIHLNLLFCKSVLKGSMACSLCSYCIFGLCQSFGILEERRLSQTTSLSGLRWRHEQVFTELGLLQATTRHKSLAQRCNLFTRNQVLNAESNNNICYQSYRARGEVLNLRKGRKCKIEPTQKCLYRWNWD